MFSWIRKVFLSIFLFITFYISPFKHLFLSTNSKKIEKENIASEVVDFEYFWPTPDRFAFTWYAVGSKEICSSLTSMMLLKKKTKSKNVDFLLQYLPSLDSDNKEEILRSEELVEKWLQRGGFVEEFQISNLTILSNLSLLKLHLKYHAYNANGYSRLVLLDPNGTPVRALEHLFYQEDPLIAPQAVIAAPRQPETVSSKPEMDLPPCESGHEPLVSTKLMVIIPAPSIRDRIFQHIRAKSSPKSDDAIINQEFHCNDEIAPLNHSYLQPDTNFMRGSQSTTPFSDTFFMYFSVALKPWHPRYGSHVLPRLQPEFRDAIMKWRIIARKNSCLDEENHEP